MKLIPLQDRHGRTVGHTVVDDADYTLLAPFRWRLNPNGYVRRSANGHKVYMHRQILGLKHGDRRKTDHENGDKLDNRRSNLRVATTAQNNQNITVARSRSGHRGVVYHRLSGKWMAYGYTAGRQHHLGLFDTVEEAAKAAVDWRREHMPFSTT